MTRVFSLPSLTGNANNVLTVDPTETFVYWANGAGGSILLETDGTINGAQGLLNLVSGAGISLNDDGLGNITISSTVSAVAIGDPVIGGTPNEVLFIDAAGNLADSADFLWTDVTKVFSLSGFGNGTFIVDPTNQLYALGGYTGGGIGNALKIDNSLNPGGNYIKLQGASGDRLLYDGNNNLYKFGDIDAQNNSTLLTIDDGNQVITGFASTYQFNTASYTDGLIGILNSGIVNLGDANGDVNNTAIIIDDRTAHQVITNLFGSSNFILHGTTNKISAKASEFIVTGSLYPDGLLDINDTTGVVAIGDAIGDVNGTNIMLDDPNRLITYFANEHLFTGRVEQNKGSNIVAANNLTLGLGGNTFTITGNTTINAITTANWQGGSHVTLIFTGTPTVNDNTTGGAGTAKILLAGSVPLSAANNTVLGLIYDGVQWQETFRKVA